MDNTAMVRIDKKIISKVRRHTKKTKQSIGGFFELAAKEKLTRDNTVPETAWLGTGELKSKESGV